MAMEKKIAIFAAIHAEDGLHVRSGQGRQTAGHCCCEQQQYHSIAKYSARSHCWTARRHCERNLHKVKAVCGMAPVVTAGAVRRCAVATTTLAILLTQRPSTSMVAGVNVDFGGGCPNTCSGRGYCTDPKTETCSCYQGWTGGDCSIRERSVVDCARFSAIRVVVVR